MPLQPRDRLGPYEIQALLGVGGMGEVYRGRDTRLGRDVALKVISPTRLGDAELRRRFELEARAASVLNHPSIVTIYDVGETAGVSWIAMEWVEGRTLREALIDGPLSVASALTIARQVAEGLATAHGRGIVHRDLKPENVMLTVDGRTKILDFGLARQTVADSLESAGSNVDTLAALRSEPTVEGSILGTVGYMSPEQASGRPVDFHSDQFSFGLIVYEMLAGRRAFSRPTAVQTLSAIITDEPAPLATIRNDTPAPLQNLIARCLAKRPEDRFASTRDIVVAIEYLGAGISTASMAPISSVSPAPAATAPAPPVGRPQRWPRAAIAAGAVLAIALAAAAWMRFGAAKQPIESLAVLPFASAGGETDTEYLGDGLTESLIDQLSRVPTLKLMARATVFRFKGTTDPQEAGRKLGVGAILTGIVGRRGNDVSISAELIEAATGALLWGKDYDRPLSDLLPVQDEIAAAVCDGLRLRLTDAEKRALVLHGTTNPEAYELALKARYFFQKETEEDYLEAMRLYGQAVQKDPAFVEARLGMVRTYAGMAVNGYVPPAEVRGRYLAEIAKVQALDPNNALVRTSLAIRRFYFDWDWSGAEADLRDLARDERLLRGEQFRPVALYFWARGRADQAVALMERALRVDPGNVASRTMLGDFLAHDGQLEKAQASYKAAVEADPSNPTPYFGLADVLARREDARGAIDALRKAYELAGEEEAAKALAAARTKKDYEDAQIAVARARLDELEGIARERYVSPLDLARFQARAGEKEKAFASLEAAYAERSPGLVFLKVDRAWDSIRDDPRFASVVRRVGIP